MRRARSLVPLAAAFLLGVTAFAVAERWSPAGDARAAGHPGIAQETRTQASDVRLTPVVRAARRVAPSVVSVNVTRRERVAPSSFFDDFFAPFIPFGYEREVAGVGSGFAIAPGGVILTNAHVVRGAQEIVVTTDDGRDLAAELLGADDLSDLAVLRVDASIPVPPFGRSDDLMIGEPALAIGNPFGYLLSNPEATVTAGVISGVGRDIVPYATPVEEGQRPIYADMIQTDASINPGNSGGPLVNADGEVIGVNSSIFSRSGGSIGLGFAIPIDRALRIADEIRERGYVRRAWVGLDVAPAERGPIGRPRGAAVARVAPGSPAERAGIRPGMRLLAVNGRPIKSPFDWEAELLDLRVGDRAVLTVRQDGRQRDLTLRVDDLPSVRARRVAALEGLELVTLTAPIRAERGLRSRRGALIVDIAPEISRAIGLRPGDLIVQLNQWRIESAEQAAEALRLAAGRGAVRIYYERDGTIWSTTFYL